MTDGIHSATTSITSGAADAYCGGSSCEGDIVRAVALVSGRWAVPVLEALVFARAPVRFRELQRRLDGISRKELTRQLTLFVYHSVASRREGAVARRAVEYALTERGMALARQVDHLGRWTRCGTAREPHRA